MILIEYEVLFSLSKAYSHILIFSVLGRFAWGFRGWVSNADTQQEVVCEGKSWQMHV